MSHVLCPKSWGESAAWLVLSILISLALVACNPQEESGALGTHLAACTAEESAFARIPFRQWPAYFHGTGSTIIEEHLNTLQTISATQLRCAAATPLNALPAAPKLRALAATLPPWKSPARLNALSQLHVGPVLLDFLRIYECANLERQRVLVVTVQERRGQGMSSIPKIGMGRGEFVDEERTQQRQIEREMHVARTTMERTLALLGGLDNLRGIAVELECLKRASLDLRNTVGLAADASACLSKVPGKSSLRDLAIP